MLMKNTIPIPELCMWETVMIMTLLSLPNLTYAQKFPTPLRSSWRSTEDMHCMQVS